MTRKTPPAEVTITKDLVQRLLQVQHPDLANLSIEFMGEGWDNSMFLLGTGYLVRLPRRQAAVVLLRNEQKWLPYFASKVPFTIPAPIRIGEPTDFYPWHWSILPFVKGTTADLDLPNLEQVPLFAQFLKAVHQPAPDDAPINELRGVPIQQRAASVEERLKRLEVTTPYITDEIKEIWKAALAAPLFKETCWLHGDLHPKNIIVNNGKIESIIDWGDITSGDVASDLACIWLIFDTAETRQQLIELYNPSPDLLARAKGWAIFYGAFLLEIGLVDNPPHARIGRLTLERLNEDALFVG